MTDTMGGGGRGGVGIRLFVNGGEVVKRTFDQVGDSGRKMWAQIALGEKAANPALRAFSRASGEAQGAVVDLGARTGAASNILGAFGATGVAAAAALGAVVVAMQQTREALVFADGLEDSAAKINIGVEALQEWRFAAMEAGGAATDADSAIDGFQKKLGEAMAGGRSAKWFERLGFDGSDLKAFASTEAALEATIRSIAALETEAERAAVSEKLGLGPLIPLVRQGADAIDDMRQRARDLGIVMDEAMVQRGAEANREMEILSQVIDLQLKQAFIDLAPVLLETLKFVGWLAEGLRDAAEAWKDLDQRSTAGLRDEYDRHQAVITRYMNRPGVTSPDDLDPMARRQFDQSNARMGEITGALQRRAALRGPGPSPRGPGLVDISTPRGAGRGGGSDRAAEALDRDRDRALQQLVKEGEAAERRALQAQYAADTAEDRSALALALLELDKAERDTKRAALEAELKRTGALDDAVKAQFEQLRAMDASADALAEQAILDQERRELAERTLEQDTARAERTITLLELELQLAATGQERVEIARRILLAEQALERAVLEAELRADGVFSEDDRNRLGDLIARQAIEREVFDHNSREDLRREFVSYGQSIVQAVEEGRLGEEIADQLKARLIDIALNGLFDFLNPRGGGGPAAPASSAWSTVASVASQIFGAGRGPGRAGGGPAMAGVHHPVVEDGRPELLILGGKGQVTSAAETVRMLRDAMDGPGGGANGGRTILHQHIWRPSFDGAVMTQDLLDQMKGMAIQAESSAVGRSLDMARRAAPAQQQSFGRLGT